MPERYSGAGRSRTQTRARRRKKAAYRKPQQNRVSMFLVTAAVLVIVAVIAVSAIGLQKKIDAYDEKIAELEAEIQREEERAQKLEEFRKYTQTKGYVEEVAQEQLGLVYDGEILFKRE